ncbi:MAG: Wzz/FepE/Etk N-terminal domain-containing protein [Clostridiales bacterium]|nr:Wzz/FepE/Etk N-terminal domain-containing protein [Clostridiales bacterium]
MDKDRINANNTEEEIQINIFEIVNALIRYAWIIILTGIIFMAVFAAYTHFCIDPTYTSSLSFYVKNSETQSSITAITSNEISSAVQLAKTYTVILQDDSILEMIGSDLIEEFGAERIGEYYTIVENNDGTLTIEANELAGQIKMEPIDETEILGLTVVTRDPVFSAAICRSYEEIAPDELKRIVGIDYIESIGTAKIATAPSGPNVKRNAAVGLLLGVFISGFVVVLLNLMDSKIYDGDTVRNEFNVTVFGEIPYYEFS